MISKKMGGMSRKEDEGCLVSMSRSEVPGSNRSPQIASNRAGFLPGLNTSPLSGFCMETEALGHESGGGFGFIGEVSCGAMAEAFSMTDSCPHPRDGGPAWLPCPLGSTGERELETQRWSFEHVETRSREFKMNTSRP